MTVSPETVHDLPSEAGLLVEEMIPRNRLHLVNSVLCQLLGYSESEFLNMTSEEFTHADDRPREAALAQKMLRGEQNSYELEKRYLHRNGSPVWVAMTSSAVRANGGTVLYRVSVIQDITDRKWAEEHFGPVVEAMPNGLVLVNQEGKIVLVNSQTEKLFDYRREELLGRSIEVLVPETFRNTHPEFRRGYLADPQARPMGAGRDLYGRRKDGSLVPVEVGLGPIKAQEDIWILSSIIDITDRKRVEEYRFRHSAIVESSDDAIISKTPEGVILSWNSGAQRMFGYTEQEAIGQPIRIIIPPELRHEENEIQRGLRAGERIEHFETIRVSKNGKRINVSITVSPVRDAAGRIVGASKIVRDITERKRGEAALRESEERFRLVANTAPVMIWMTGLDKLCSYVNQPCLEFAGKPAEALLGNGWTERIHSDDLARSWDIYRTAFDRHEPFHMEYRFRRHDGEYRWVIASGVPRFNADGSFAGYVGSAIDATERKLAEEALSRVSGRLIEAQDEGRRRIARELHDDVSQKLGMLMIGLQDLAMITPESQAQVRTRIDSLLQRISEMTNDVHELSHRLHTSKLELVGLVGTMRSFCRELAEQRHVEIDFTHIDVPMFLPSQVSLCLYRILQEGLGNAVKYSGVRNFEVRLERVADALQLTIRDSGVGFDPTSVKNDQGIGLISMRERVNLVKGTLSIESKPGKGTQINVRVPIAAQTSADQKSASA